MDRVFELWVVEIGFFEVLELSLNDEFDMWSCRCVVIVVYFFVCNCLFLYILLNYKDVVS